MKNYYFVKKFIFSIAFIITLFVFFVADFVMFRDDFSLLGREFADIDDIRDVKAWVTEAEDTITSDVMGKMRFIELYGYIQRLMGKREFNDFAYIKDDDDMLYYGAVTELDTGDLDEYAGNIKRLDDYCKSRGAKLLVVFPPTKILYGVSSLNKQWTINDPNNRTDRMLVLLSEYGVSTIDFRSYFEKSGMSLEDMFFRTDHHWTPLAAFEAFRILVDKMNELYDANLDPDGYYRDLSNYYSYTYENCFLGSTGESAGAVYSGLDDYTFYWPKCDMQFKRYDYEHHDEDGGVMSDSLMYTERIDGVRDVYDTSLGSIYLREIVDSERIINKSNPDGPKIMMLRDSYFSPVAVFMAPLVSQMDLLWTRNESGIKMEDYIKDGEFDYLILEVYPYNFDEVSFDFFREESK